MIPFYGGLNGQSFKIKQVFNNRQELIDDLSSAWTSAIGVGEYVAIYYGKPGTDTYASNLNSDVNKNYNSTVWQKIYRETGTLSLSYLEGLTSADADYNTFYSNGQLDWIKVYNYLNSQAEKEVYLAQTNSNGLGYKLLFWTAGQMPALDFTSTVDRTVAEGPILIETTDQDVDSPDVYRYVLHLSPAQKIQLAEMQTLVAGSTPIISDDASEIPDTITIQFSLPQGQSFETVHYQVLNAAQLPYVEQENYDDNDIYHAHPLWKFYLPQAQTFSTNVRLVEPQLHANEFPRANIEYDDDTKNTAILRLGIPRAQIMRSGETGLNELRPSATPTAEIQYTDSSTQDEPYLVLGLPRAVNYYMGEAFGQPRSYTVSDNINKSALSNNIKVEDFYIYEPLGFIYKITSINEQTGIVTADYVACIQAPLPTIIQNPISPYEDDGSQNEVFIDYNQPVDQTNWTVTIDVPRTPIADANVNFVAPGLPSDNPGSVNIATAKAETGDNETMLFKFEIPRGSKWFVGTAVNTNGSTVLVDGVGKGDFYLNNSDNGYSSSSGKVYQWDGVKWNEQSGLGLLGKTGPALNTITDTIDVTSDYGTLDAVKDYLTSEGWNPAPDELIPVLWPSDLSSAQSYWFFKPGDASNPNRPWDSVLLTGNISAITATNYTTNANLVYNTIYVNNLSKNINDAPENPTSEQLLARRQYYSVDAVNTLIENLNNRIAALEEALAEDKLEQQSWGAIRDLIKYYVSANVTYYSDVELTTEAGTTSEKTIAKKINDTYGEIIVDDTIYYVSIEDIEE